MSSSTAIRHETKKDTIRIVIRSINSDLPPHIIQVIFSKLPISQFPFCRLVSKYWNSCLLDLSSTPNFQISNTFLVSSEFSKFPSDPNTRRFALHSVQYTPTTGINFSASFRLHPIWSNVSIASSCHGLLCIIKPIPPPNSAVVLNPMTNEYLKLPSAGDLTETTYICSKFYYYGFGFSPKTNQYKMARVAERPKTANDNCLVDIFTFGKSVEWRHVGTMPFSIHSHGVYSDGALYWLGITNKGDRNAICRLNVDDDKFDAVFVWNSNDVNIVSIGSFDAGFYAAACKDKGNKFEVWIMKTNEQGKRSWTKQFVIDNIQQFWELEEFWKLELNLAKLQLIQTCDDGNILCLLYQLYFILYNPKTGNIKRLNRTEEITMNETEGGGRQKILAACLVDSFKFDTLQKIFAGNNNA